jgi:hypothetical protein
MFASKQFGGDYSKMSGGDYSTLVGGHSSTLSGGDKAILMGGPYSVLTWAYFDMSGRERMHTVYVGEDGIEADTAYVGFWDASKKVFVVEKV